MSDFDKEAEREKLRKKFEREEEKRKATEQMSELLLKGATMTNAHCSDCGDPIFRYDGQEFCPTCQKPVDRGKGDDADGGGDEAGESSDETADAGENGEGDGEHIEVTKPSDDATVQFGGGDGTGQTEAEDDADTPEPDQPDGDRDADRVQQDTDAPRPTAGSTDERRRSEDVRQIPSADPTQTSSSDPATTSGQSERAALPRAGEAGDHLDRARVILAQTVERFAGRAAEADSPREAREHLEAAREAAETLEAAGF